VSLHRPILGPRTSTNKRRISEFVIAAAVDLHNIYALCSHATNDKVDASPRLLLSLDKLFDEPYKLFRLLRMHPMARIKRLQAHVREEPSSDRFVTFGNVPRLGPLDEQSWTFPCGFARGVGKVADSRDGGGEDVKRDSEFKGLGLGVDKAVCEEELADGEFL
jgi:hypothetical protein